MKIRALLFICCTTILVSAVEAKIKEDKGTPKQIVHIKKMDKRVSELMADRVNIRKNMELKELATLSEIEMEEKENLMFPADELYGSNWENRWVDPFRGTAKVNFPDSFAIDCSSFVYPIAIDSMARITSKYGPRRRRMHKGIDLKVLKGDTIRAAFNGKVRIKAFVTSMDMAIMWCFAIRTVWKRSMDIYLRFWWKRTRSYVQAKRSD